MRIGWRAKWVTGVVGAALVAGSAGAMALQAKQAVSATPSNWNYELKDGKRVPKGNRVTNPDGGWREEVRQGPCVTVKQKTANGDYSETRKCD